MHRDGIGISIPNTSKMPTNLVLNQFLPAAENPPKPPLQAPSQPAAAPPTTTRRDNERVRDSPIDLERELIDRDLEILRASMKRKTTEERFKGYIKEEVTSAIKDVQRQPASVGPYAGAQWAIPTPYMSFHERQREQEWEDRRERQREQERERAKLERDRERERARERERDERERERAHEREMFRERNSNGSGNSNGNGNGTGNNVSGSQPYLYAPYAPHDPHSGGGGIGTDGRSGTGVFTAHMVEGTKVYDGMRRSSAGSIRGIAKTVIEMMAKKDAEVEVLRQRERERERMEWKREVERFMGVSGRGLF